MGDDIVIRPQDGGAVTVVDPDPGFDQINDVTMNPFDTTNAFVVDRNQVLSTVDGGTNWVDITGNLLALAGREIRTATYIPGSGAIDALVESGIRAVFGR